MPRRSTGTSCLLDVTTSIPGDHLGIVVKVVVQCLNHFWRCALLRTENGSRTVIPGQRVSDIGSNRNCGLCNPGINLGNVDSVKVGQGTTAEADWFSIGL